MKLNNLEILNAYNVFQYLYNKADIKSKWKIMEMSEEIYKIKSRFDLEKDAIISEFGTENKENGVKEIDPQDDHFQELLACESDIAPLSLDDVMSLGLSYDEMMVLKPLIETR